MSERKKISLIVPFYNEGEGVEHFHQAIRPIVDGLPAHDFEIICIDDGSRDDTLSHLVAVAERDARFLVGFSRRNPP